MLQRNGVWNQFRASPKVICHNYNLFLCINLWNDLPVSVWYCFYNMDLLETQHAKDVKPVLIFLHHTNVPVKVMCWLFAMTSSVRDKALCGRRDIHGSGFPRQEPRHSARGTGATGSGQLLQPTGDPVRTHPREPAQGAGARAFRQSEDIRQYDQRESI